MTITAYGAPFTYPNQASPTDKYEAIFASVAFELNQRPFLRRRLMLKDGRVDFFEAGQLIRHLRKNTHRSAEQETTLRIASYLREQRHNFVAGPYGEIMMYQICRVASLPQRYEPKPAESLTAQQRNELWKDALQLKPVLNHGEENKPPLSPVVNATETTNEQNEKSSNLEAVKMELLQRARNSLFLNGITEPTPAQTLSEMMRLNSSK